MWFFFFQLSLAEDTCLNLLLSPQSHLRAEEKNSSFWEAPSSGFLLAFCFRLTEFLSIKAIHPFCFSIGDILLPSPLKSPLSDRRGQVTRTNGPTHNSNLRPELCWPSLFFRYKCFAFLHSFILFYLPLSVKRRMFSYLSH